MDSKMHATQVVSAALGAAEALQRDGDEVRLVQGGGLHGVPQGHVGRRHARHGRGDQVTSCAKKKGGSREM